jgi:hypothetical protein
MKKGGAQYYTEVDRCGEKIYCSCSMTWIYGLASLPVELLTEKGREMVAKGREMVRA